MSGGSNDSNNNVATDLLLARNNHYYDYPMQPWESAVRTASVLVPSWTTACLKTCFYAAVALYVLNQKHLLPKPLSALVSKALFWPSLPLTVIKRIGSWSTKIDDTVLLGGLPLGFVNYPEKLYQEYNVRGVINMCAEYQGPDSHYKRLGIKHLRLPTVDHFEPTVADLERAVAFIKKLSDDGSRVYVHCKAGHGRSAAVVFAWLIYNDPKADLEELNKEFCLMRNVRKKLWKQKNILDFRTRLQNGDIELTELDDSYVDSDDTDKEL